MTKIAEMKFMMCTTGYSLLDHKRNKDILQEFKAYPVENKLAQYKQKWLNNINQPIRRHGQLLNIQL
jgi:hypothetical protein